MARIEAAVTWFRVDDKSHSHPKVLVAGNAAWGLYVRCGAWCADQLTDGKIPKNVAKLFGKPSECRALVAAGLWTENGEFYVIPDYLEFNPSRQRVEGERASARERMLRRRSGEQQPNEQENFGRGSATPTQPNPISKETTQHQDSFARDPGGGVEPVEERRQQVAARCAEMFLAQQDQRQIANVAGWLHSVTQRVLRSHSHEIDRALEMGLAVGAIADRIVNPNATPEAEARRLVAAREYGASVAQQQLDNDLVDRSAFMDEIKGWSDEERDAARGVYDERIKNANKPNVVPMRRNNV